MKNQKRRFCVSVLAACLAAFSVHVQAEPDLLPPDEAFRVAARQVEPRVVEIDYIIAPGYHLYRDRFSFAADNSAVKITSIDLPPSLVKFDKAMGQNMQYYTERLTVRVRLSGANVPVKLVTKAQGCAEVGVCYPPITKAFSVPAAEGRKG